MLDIHNIHDVVPAQYTPRKSTPNKQRGKKRIRVDEVDGCASLQVAKVKTVGNHPDNNNEQKSKRLTSRTSSSSRRALAMNPTKSVVGAIFLPDDRCIATAGATDG